MQGLGLRYILELLKGQCQTDGLVCQTGSSRMWEAPGWTAPWEPKVSQAKESGARWQLCNGLSVHWGEPGDPHKFLLWAMRSRGLCKVVINIAEITRHVIPEQCLAHGGHQMNAKSIFQCLQVFAHLLPDTGYLKCVRENTGLQVCMYLSDQAHFTVLLPSQSRLSPLWVIPLLSSFPSSCPP